MQEGKSYHVPFFFLCSGQPRSFKNTWTESLFEPLLCELGELNRVLTTSYYFCGVSPTVTLSRGLNIPNTYLATHEEYQGHIYS